MSVPAAKALAPAPVITTALTEPSRASTSHSSARRAYMGNVSALNFSGRLSVMVITGPSRATRISSVMPCSRCRFRRIAAGPTAPRKLQGVSAALSSLASTRLFRHDFRVLGRGADQGRTLAEPLDVARELRPHRQQAELGRPAY